MINVEFASGGIGVTDPTAAWRRWFEGPFRLHEGTQVTASGLAVVVIGFRAEEDLAAAVTSVRAQAPAEIVVVNTGGGDARGKLGPHLDHIRLIDIDAPLLVGAARNIGIDASRAPYVAFLAGDCMAAPGWVAARLEAHLAGARAVASAVAPPEGASYWTRAAHLFLFGTRAPQVPAEKAQRYGASYDRRVFAEYGYFNPALRIGEDSDLVARLGPTVQPAWTRDVVTIHGGPPTAAAYLRDMHARGRRAARYQTGRRKGRPIIEFVRYVRARHNIAIRVARDALQLPAAGINRMRPALWLGALAYVAGVQRGFFRLDSAGAELTRSRDALTRGDLTTAIEHARSAADGNSEDLPTLLHLADLVRRSRAETEHFTTVLRRIAWLSAFAAPHQLALCDWLLERGLHEEATVFAELCKLGTPGETAVSQRLASRPEAAQ
jgi:hypothetical protein